MKGLKRLLCILLSVSIIMTVMLSGAMTVEAASSDVWTESSYANIFQDTMKPVDASSSISLIAAKNEFEAAQIVIRRGQEFTINSVTFTNLTSGSDTIASSNLKYQFVEYEYLDNNSVFNGWYINNLVRKGAGYYPDALSNSTSISVPANTTQPIWVRAYIPKTAAAGVYTGTATVNTSLGNQSVSISVDVKNVTIPDAKNGNFDCALWTQYCGPTSWYEPYDDMYIGFEANRYTTEWWQVVANIAQFMKDYRNNNLTVNMCYLLMDGGTYKDSNGTYQFNWSKFDEVIQFFIDRDAVKRLEGLFMSQKYNFSDRFLVEILDTDQYGHTFRTYSNPGTALANGWIDQFIPALRNHLDAKGWTNMWWMHIGDEPISQQQADDYKAISDRVKLKWNRSDLKLGDAFCEQATASQLPGYTNIWVPLINIYDDNMAFYNARKAAGDELWLYNCIIPAGMYLNRTVDQPVWTNRETIWYAYKRNMTGYLHWGFNAWHWPMSGQDSQALKGDAWIVKADKPNYKLKPTIRYESLRDGIEDYELLKIVEQANPDLAKSIADSLVTLGYRYARDTGYMMQMRANLVRAAAGLPIFSTDAAYNKTAAASSQASGYEASKAVDNNASTAWKSTAAGSQWINVDLGAQYKLNGVRLNWGAPYATNYSIQTSYDGTKWNNVYSNTTGNGGADFAGINAKARYLRILCDASSGTAYTLNSLEVGGGQLPGTNLAGGKPYAKSHTPNSTYADNLNNESVDGIPAGDFFDGKSYGYQLSSGTLMPNITIDLGSVQTVGQVKVHGYEPFEHNYTTEYVKVFTSTDNVNFTQKGHLKYTNGSDGLWYDLTFPATSARYVRVEYFKTYVVNQDWLFIDEIEVYSPPTTEAVNFAQGRPYTKSENPSSSHPDTGNAESTNGVLGGSFADGHSYGYQLSSGQTKTVSLTVDMGSNKTVNLAKLRKYEDLPYRYAPDSVKVYTSTDGTTFTLKGEAAYPTGLWFDISFANTTARYVRFEAKKTYGAFADWMFIDEIAVYGDPGNNVASGKSYTKSIQPSSSFPDTNNAESTDVILAGGYTDGKSYGYSIPSGQSVTVDITVDLGVNRTTGLVKFRKYNGTEHNYGPDSVTVFTSTDGTNFTQKGQSTSAVSNWYEVNFADTTARYVRIRADKTYGSYADWLFVDEIEVYGY